MRAGTYIYLTFWCKSRWFACTKRQVTSGTQIPFIPVQNSLFCIQKPHHTCCFCMQNFDFWTRITSLYGSQTWPVILCMYNSVLNIRITSLYGSQPSSVVFAFKTAWLASELLVSMSPRPHHWFLDSKQRLLDRNNKSLWVPNITCRFVHAKQHDLHQNDNSIWVPALICVFFHANSDFRTSITSLNGSQTSSVVLSTHNSVLSTRINRLYWF